LEDDIKNESPRTVFKWLTNRVPGRDFATSDKSWNFGAELRTVLRLGHFEKGITEGWRSVGPIVREMKYYTQSRKRGISYIQGRLTGVVTCCVGTGF